MQLKLLFQKITYERKVLFMVIYSVILNAIIAAFKFVLAYIFRDSGGGFFIISGIVNIFIMLSKGSCYLYSDNENNISFHTFMVGLFMIISAITYTAYMSRLLFFETMHIEFPTWVAIAVCATAFVELVLSVRGLFKVRGRGHMYRNIMIINLGISIYAMVLAQVMILSFTMESKAANYYDGIFGIIAGIINIVLSIFIWFGPKISLIDRSHNVYELIEGKNAFEDENVNIILVSNPIYGKVVFLGINEGNKISGEIVREFKRFKDFKWYFLLPALIFYVVIIIPYLIGALIFYFYSARSVSMLNKRMLKNGYRKKEED